MPARPGLLRRIAARSACACVLALSLALPAAPADAAVAKQRKASAKHPKHAVAKKDRKKAKVVRKKPVAKKTAVRKPPFKAAAVRPPPANPARAQRQAAAMPDERLPAAEKETVSSSAAAACRRDGRIYLLADCDAPLPLVLSTTIAADRPQPPREDLEVSGQ